MNILAHLGAAAKGDGSPPPPPPRPRVGVRILRRDWYTDDVLTATLYHRCEQCDGDGPVAFDVRWRCMRSRGARSARLTITRWRCPDGHLYRDLEIVWHGKRVTWRPPELYEP